MKIRLTLLLLLLINFVGYNQDTYYKVTKKLDGAYAKTSSGILKFLYNEEYKDSDNLLEYRVYDWKRQVVQSNSTSSITTSLGTNQLEINTNNSNFTIGSFYLLEIVNEKNEKWYLRFKVEDLPPLITDNLVLHYDFNDPASYSGSGTTITDLVSQHNGTITGTPTSPVSRNVGSTTGLTGNCMNFDGSQGIDIANNFNHTDWTVSYWFHYKGVNTYYQRFWGMGSYRIELAETNGYFYVYDGGWINTGVAVPTSDWQKITFAYDDNPKKFTIRINGITVYTATRGRSMNTYAKICNSIDNRKAKAYIGEILVYGKYLSDEEELYNFNASKEDYGYENVITDNLVLHYDFNDPASYNGSGTTVTDLVSQHNGTITGTPISTSRNVGSTTGLNGNCMEFNGSQGINVANNFNHTDWTVSYWFHYRAVNTYYQRFWGMGGYRIEIAETNGYFYVYDGGWTNTGVAVPTTNWQKITFAYQDNPKKFTIRVNGSVVYTSTRGRSMNTYAKISNSIDNRRAQSYISEVLVYSKYLTDQEELYNYNSAKAEYGY